MNIKQLTERIAAHVPSGWEFWAGRRMTQYNLEKDVQDTLVMILPASYPIWWRDGKQKQMKDFEFRVVKTTSIKNERTEDQQHLPYDGVDIQAAMESFITYFANELTTDDSIRVVSVQPMMFDPLPDNATVNAQVVGRVVMTLELFCVEPVFDFGMYPVSLTYENNPIIYDYIGNMTVGTAPGGGGFGFDASSFGSLSPSLINGISITIIGFVVSNNTLIFTAAGLFAAASNGDEVIDLVIKGTIYTMTKTNNNEARLQIPANPFIDGEQVEIKAKLL
jgi:hypothetical protein